MRSALLALVLAVHGAATAIAVPPTASDEEPTFTRDVAPIVFAKCLACHRDGEAGPFALLSYEDVRRRARQIALVTRQKIMPPWKPVDPPGTFKYERSLTDAEVAAFQRWAEAGAPEGDREDLPAAPTFPTGWHLGPPDMVLTLNKPFAIAAEGPDVYVHFVFPLELSADKYVRAVQVLPSNRRVAHHGVILLDGSGKARQLAAAQGGDHYFNFGEPGFVPRGLLPGYAPGQTTRPIDDNDPAGVGLTLGRGLDVVLQMHYHPTGKPESDRPQIGLYFTNQKPRRGPNILVMANNDIDIPPHDAEFRCSDSLELPVDFEVRDVWAHMHLIGTRVTAWAELPDGTRKDLLTINDWDFNWQDTYAYAEPFVLPAKSVIRAEWVWDNSVDNPSNPNVPPQRITWGPGSGDEMSGLIVGGVSVRAGWEEAALWVAVLGHYMEIERHAKRAAELRATASASSTSDDD